MKLEEQVNHRAQLSNASVTIPSSQGQGVDVGKKVQVGVKVGVGVSVGSGVGGSSAKLLRGCRTKITLNSNKTGSILRRDTNRRTNGFSLFR